MIKKFFTAFMSIGLLACNPNVQDAKNNSSSFHATDLSGMQNPKNFPLLDHEKHQRSLLDFKGKVLIVFFGFTRCPDVCPTTMLQMTHLMQALKKNADQVQVVFITLDPEYDDSDRLKNYVTGFDKRFIGLSADVQTTQLLANEFKLFYQKTLIKNAQQGSENYSVDHTANLYVFDKQGHIRLLVRPNQATEKWVEDIQQLL